MSVEVDNAFYLIARVVDGGVAAIGHILYPTAVVWTFIAGLLRIERTV
jgi:hypothetical protein